jgi:hypothetical protein
MTFEAAVGTSAIEWLNANSGAIQAASTTVLVIITAWYALSTRQLLRATRQSQRPYVYLDLSSEGGDDVQIGVANYGERAAENISFKVHRDVTGPDGQPLTASTPIRRGIAYLPPGRGYHVSLTGPDNLYSAGSGVNVLDIEISYRRGRDRYEERLVVDFFDFDGVLLKSFRSSGEGIARGIRELGSRLRAIERRLSAPLEQMFDRPCPSCRRLVAQGATKCPHCHDHISVGSNDSDDG